MSTSSLMRDLAIRMGLSGADFTPPRPLELPCHEGTLRVYDWGGEGPPVLLLHGGGRTGRTWDFVCLQLRGEARLLAMDLRGHGDSGWSDHYDLDGHVSDVLKVQIDLDIAGCHLVGMSLGGAVSALAARAVEAGISSLL